MVEVFEEKSVVYFSRKTKFIFYQYFDYENRFRYAITKSALSDKFVAKFSDGKIIGEFNTHEEALNSFTTEKN